MKYITFIILLLSSNILFAQKETLDYASFTPPNGWTKEVKQSSVVYSIVDKATKTWCQIAVYKNTASKGNIDNDFNSEWITLIKPLGVTNDAQTSDVKEIDGWSIKSGAASFNFNGSTALTSLTTFCGYNNCFSIVANTNNKDFVQTIQDFVDSVTLSKPDVANNNNQTINNNVNEIQPAVATNYTFNTTNFNDGYTSTIQPDWVEVTKGNLKVLIHYQNAISQWYNPNRDVEDQQIWNNVIATRYSSINNYEHLSNNHSYEIIHFMAANATDKNGKQVFVAMYKKGGINSTWLEYIFPNRAAFTQIFGIDKYDWSFNGWEPLAKVYDYNKFAVSSKDLVGLWTNDFSSMTQYYNVYTGNSAGTKTYQSAQDYNFTSTTSYSWKIQVISGFVGSFDQQHAASKGTFSMPDNWSIHFSDMEGKPKTCALQFTAIKGGRILWIDGNAFVKK